MYIGWVIFSPKKGKALNGQFKDDIADGVDPSDCSYGVNFVQIIIYFESEYD